MKGPSSQELRTLGLSPPQGFEPFRPTPPSGLRAELSRLSRRLRMPPLRSPERTARLAKTREQPALPPLGVITLNRAAFGPAPGDLEHFQSLGSTDAQRLEAWVDWQLQPDSISDTELESRIVQSQFQTLHKSLRQLWVEHVVPDPDFEVRMLPLIETQYATALRAVYSRRQLVEVLADFWHNHFNIFGWHFYSGPVFVHYDRDVIRANLLGNFRQMLEEMSASTAMLLYLDNVFNSGDGPNENFAREVLELHTLGEENYYGAIPADQVPLGNDGVPLGYVDEDLRELARCLTGWSISELLGEFLYRDTWHDTGPKEVMGLSIPANQAQLKDYRDVMDRLASHPGTARFVCRKLCQRLLADDPPESLVQAAADVFLDNRDQPDQLSRVTRTILLSDEFATTWGGKVRRPFELMMSSLRAMNPDIVLPTGVWFSQVFAYLMYTTGHYPFGWAPPTGYPDRKSDWLTTNALIGSWRFTNFMSGWEDEGYRPCRIVDATPGAARTAEELADFWIDRVFGRPLDASFRQEVVEFMAQGNPPDVDLNLDNEPVQERLRTMVGLLLTSPEFHWR